MFELSKTVLERVSFDKSLFRKELKKSLKYLSLDEMKKLKLWAIAAFGHMYADVIIETFESI